MFQIRTIQRESKNRTDFTVAIPPRAKKIQPSSSPMVRIAENPQKNFIKNPSGIFSRTFAALLVGFFLFNPFLDVYADELPLLPVVPFEEATPPPAPPPPETTLEAITATSSPEIILPPIAETENATTTDGESSTTTAEVSTSTSTPEEIAPIAEEMIASSTPIIETNTATSTATTTEEALVAETTEDALSTPKIIENSPETEAVVPKEPEETTREMIREVVREVVRIEQAPTPAPIVNVIEKKYLFRENECTLLDDGAFYCLPPETASTTNISNVSLPRVFTENDAKSGSKEIFFEDASGKIQITNNSTDDDAPAYDKNSNLIVWHSLINGRFQIMLYDRNASTTRSLTNTPYNNTDPKIRGKSVVWQGWANNNWEIFYLKDVTAEPLKIDQITTNEQPDMFPILSDNFITWQSFFGGSWRVFVYNIENGEISQISQPEAGRYENPRFALLFENRKENGEVETVGYDVVSGKEIPINAPHVPIPATPTPQGEEDKAVPVPTSGGSASTTQAVKNPGKDEENHEA